MGKQPAQHAPASEHRSDQASATARAPVGAPAPGQVDALVSSTTATRAPGLAVAPSMDLGDPLIGTRNSHEFVAFNLDPHMQANLQVRFEGHPSIMLTEAPETLWPSTENNPKPVKLWFMPTSDAPVATTAILRANWQMNARPAEEHRVQITGAGRQAFAPTRQQKVEAAEAEKARQASEAERATQRHEAETFIESYLGRPVLGGHEGHRRTLDQKQAQLRAAMLDVGDVRLAGISAARARIEAFERAKPIPATPGLLESIAWMGLDAATGGLADLVVTAVAHSPVKQVLGFASTGIKAMVKKGGKAAVAGLKEAREPADVHTQAGLDASAGGVFCATQEAAFVHDRHTVAEVHSRFLADSLLQTIDQDPRGALSTMDAAIAGYSDASKQAMVEQSAATQSAWVRYVAQASMGAVEAGEARQRGLVHAANRAATTDMRAANQAPTTQVPVRTFDGLVDIRFGIDHAHPRAPVVPISAKIQGVSNQVAAQIQAKGLLQAPVPLPVRAVAVPTGGHAAVVPLTVTRDEAGNLSFTDNLHGEGQPASWLSRKAGAVRPSDEAQHQGARMLIEDDLMSRALTVPLQTDSAS